MPGRPTHAVSEGGPDRRRGRGSGVHSVSDRGGGGGGWTEGEEAAALRHPSDAVAPRSSGGTLGRNEPDWTEWKVQPFDGSSLRRCGRMTDAVLYG